MPNAYMNDYVHCRVTFRKATAVTVANSHQNHMYKNYKGHPLQRWAWDDQRSNLHYGTPCS